MSGASSPPDPTPAPAQPAIEILDKSLRWYKKYAWRARVGYRVSEVLVLVVAAAIPASVAFTSDGRVSAVLGSVVVVLTGLRTIFRWREDWPRFTQACSQLSAERDFYLARAGQYAGADRDAQLIERVGEIEAAETAGWVAMRRAPSDDPANGSPAR
jgi:Protein of unknown function (DUF4231)